MKKRPLEIKIISLIYMLLPFFYYFQVTYFEKIAALNVSRVLSFYKLEDIILTLSSVIVGISIYMVKKWGWYVFLTHAVGIIVWNGYVESQRDVHPNLELILFSLTTLFVMGLFLRKHIKSPYFNPSMRWWEHEKRHPISFKVKLSEEMGENCIEGKTFDISASGMFFDGELDDGLGKKYKIEFIEEEKLKNMNLLGEVVWLTEKSSTHPAGAGIRFLKMPWPKRNMMRINLKGIKSNSSEKLEENA